ncbi:MAG TPA: tetratricopeptide repeat protein [Candidatus Sulfotelmatobacter sp.]|nr:tetratricopeptide repeat protein [Candidatus Sulfotelmatobacter sp.]
MRNLLFIIVVACALCGWGQDSSSPSKSAPGPNSSGPADAAAKPHTPDLSPPRSDRVNAEALEPGESSSKDAQIDLSPPPEDDKAHPNSSEALEDATGPAVNGGPSEFHPWDPHKSAKNVEVGDFYFKRKNYKAAEDRYREALYYKDNDAIATYRLAICLEKLGRPAEAREEYEAYLKILPFGPESEQVHKALDRLKDTAANTKPAR